MSAGFTPGPWSIGPSHVVARRYQGDDGRRVTHWVAECVGQHSRTTIEANARLIAAAPDLYEALAALIAATEKHVFGDECLLERRAGHAALAHARGEQP